MNCTDKPQSYRWLGRVPYAVALDLQDQLVGHLERREDKEQKGDLTILGLEHPSVITLGRRADPQEDIKIKIESLDDLHIQYYKVDRGGHATLHSPGQLVIYPILNLSNNNLSVRSYLCALQKATISFFSHYGIKTFVKEDSPGVYTEKGKIAFFGIRVKKGIAFHGLSINVSNELEDFSLIKSCGTNSETFDRMNSYGISEPLEGLFYSWADHFLQNLK